MQPVIWKVDTKIDIKWRHHRSLTMDLYLRKKKIVAKISSTEKNKKLKKNNGASGWGNHLLGISFNRVCKFYWWVESVLLPASQILESFWDISSHVSQQKKPFSDFPAHGPALYTLAWGMPRSSCGGLLTWKAQIHDSSHQVNFDHNLASSCFVAQYNSLISMI